MVLKGVKSGSHRPGSGLTTPARHGKRGVKFCDCSSAVKAAAGPQRPPGSAGHVAGAGAKADGATEKPGLDNI